MSDALICVNGRINTLSKLHPEMDAIDLLLLAREDIKAMNKASIDLREEDGNGKD
ncbi:MAG: hypothetical protein JXR88_03695 [Clostridia bacterium]|nr:hypothetical protein [Clostridia bacterium]